VPVAFYSRKLTNAQRNYTVSKKELLSIVETLKEFCTMLYGCPDIHVYTGHKNNTSMFARFQTQCVLQWRLFLDDYSVNLHYIKIRLQMLFLVYLVMRGRPCTSEVQYQRSYDLLDDLMNYDSSNTLGMDTYLLVMDPLDHFHLLAAGDDLIDLLLICPYVGEYSLCPII
jgi:RNase H-like domain found in reverse transcriptase